MADNFRVLDVAVDELAANLNSLDDTWGVLTQNYYDRGEVRRVTVLLGKVRPMPINLPPGFDPYRRTRN